MNPLRIILRKPTVRKLRLSGPRTRPTGVSGALRKVLPALLLSLLPWGNSDALVLEPEVGFAYVYSFGYRDALDEAYPGHSISGGHGWGGALLAYKYKPADQFAWLPRLGVLLNYARMEDGGDSFLSMILQPAVAARLLFDPGASFFLEGEVNYSLVHTGSKAMDVDGSVGYGAFAGYLWRSGISAALGYSVVPVETTIGGRTRTKNFGGIDLRLRIAF